MGRRSQLEIVYTIPRTGADAMGVLSAHSVSRSSCNRVRETIKLTVSRAEY
jgi:hypothetical protein